MARSESFITAQLLDQIAKRLAKINAIEMSVGDLTAIHQNVMAQLNTITLAWQNKKIKDDEVGPKFSPDKALILKNKT